MSDYNIVFASDINYLPYTLVAVQSLVDSLKGSSDFLCSDNAGNSSSASTSFIGSEPEGECACDDCVTNNHGDRLIFHVLIDDTVVPEDFKARCDAFVARNRMAPVSLCFNLIQVQKEIFSGYRPWGPHKTYSAYYRLMIDRLIPDDVSSLLYLDVDVLVLQDVRELFNSTDMSQKLIAAVNEVPFFLRGSDWQLEPRSAGDAVITFDHKRYFNSGVLLINLDMWRKRRLGDQFIAFFDHYDAPYPDQDALNYLCDPDSVIYLDPSWNVQAATYELAMNTQNPFKDQYCAADIYSKTSGFAGHDGASFLSRPFIVHMTQIKPWATAAVYFRGDRPLLLSADHIRYLGQWRDTAMTVTEYGADTWQGSAPVSEIFAAGILNLHNRLIEEKSRRRKDRKKLILAFSAVSLLSLTISVCALFS